MTTIYRPELKDAVIHGYGVLGKATAYAFNIKHWQDPNGGNTTLEESAKYRYQFICVPTPYAQGQYDLTAIYDTLITVDSYGTGQGCADHVFIIRSTMLPGTCRHFASSLKPSSVVHVPEFLTENNWKQDTDFPDQVIVGADDDGLRDEVVSIFRDRYDYKVFIVPTTTITAELIKCAHNAFFSTKVVFANEVYEMAEKVGADYDAVKDALYRSKWIGRNHLDVNFQRPSWDKPRRGLHGKCLPKDLKALAAFSGSELLRVVEELNEVYVQMEEGKR